MISQKFLQWMERGGATNLVMTEVYGATSRIMMEVGGATTTMMKMHGATKSNSSNYIR